MQLTTKGRYAVTAMLDLASNESTRPVTLDMISQRQSISLSYLEQLFAKLRKAKLVKSVRGPGGGYLLNVNADEVSLTQIIEAVDAAIGRNDNAVGKFHNQRRIIQPTIGINQQARKTGFHQRALQTVGN